MSLIHNMIASLESSKELLPTRLSSRRGDKGYKSSGKLQRYRIYLNGVEQHDCEVADVKEGYVELVSIQTNKFAKTETVTRSGKITGTVEIKERAWPQKLTSPQ